MKLALDLRKTLEENASDYFEKSKKARGKIEGARKAIQMATEEQAKQTDIIIEKQAPKKIRKRAWYEKFKWFFASNGMLVIGGRDAMTNELLIKKYTEVHDVVFHTGAPGSPFVVLKTEGAVVVEHILQEVADFTASHSKAWKLGLSDAEVYWVEPTQVTKEAKAGEYMGRGSFMVYGKRNFMHPKIELAACPYEETVMIGPTAAVKAQQSDKMLIIRQGEHKASDVAKKIVAELHHGEIDDVLAGLPSGGCKVIAAD